MIKNRTPIIISILIIVIILLLGIVLYSLVIKPNINGYIVSKQSEAYNQGIQDAVTFMVREIDQRGFTQITLQDRTIILAPVQPPQ